MIKGLDATADADKIAEIKRVANKNVKGFVTGLRKTMKGKRKELQDLKNAQKERLGKETEEGDEELDDAALEAEELLKVKEDSAITAANVSYYEAKAKFNQANGMVKDQGAAQKKAQATVDASRFTTEMTDD